MSLSWNLPSCQSDPLLPTPPPPSTSFLPRLSSRPLSVCRSVRHNWNYSWGAPSGPFPSHSSTAAGSIWPPRCSGIWPRFPSVAGPIIRRARVSWVWNGKEIDIVLRGKTFKPRRENQEGKKDGYYIKYSLCFSLSSLKCSAQCMLLKLHLFLLFFVTFIHKYQQGRDLRTLFFMTIIF